MKKCKVILTCIITVTICVLFTIGISAQIKAEKVEDAEKEIVCETVYFDNDSPRIFLYTYGKTSWNFMPEEDINVYFLLTGNRVISSFEYTTNDATVTASLTDDARRVNLFIECDSNSVECSICFEFILDDGSELIENIYLVNTSHGVFVSTAAMEVARYNYLGFARKEGIITDSEYGQITYLMDKGIPVDYSGNYASDLNKTVLQSSQSEILQSGAVSAPSATASENTITIQGRMTWKDDTGNIFPLAWVRVVVYDGDNLFGDSVLATGQTTANGNYSFNITNKTEWYDFENGGYDIFVRVYAAGIYDTVKNPNNEEYYYQSGIYYNYSSSDPIEYSELIDMSSVKGQAFQIGQAIAIAQAYSISMVHRSRDVSVVYPYEPINTTDSENTHYSSTISTIFILKNKYDSGTKTYAAWDVTMHEYGHHVQYMLDIIESPGGTHYGDKNMIDEYCSNSTLNHTQDAKSAGTRIAWSEGWATVFGMMAQQYYINMTQNVAGAGDDDFNHYGTGLPMPVEASTTKLGDGCEQSIEAVLWDIYDSVNESNDELSLGHQAYWHITTGHDDVALTAKPKTFSNFVNYFYQEKSTDDVFKLGKVLTKYHMASSKPSLDGSCSSMTTPRFSWNVSTASTHFPTDEFELIFYNSNGVEFYRTSKIITTSLMTISFKLTLAEWEKVMYSYPADTSYKVAVASYQNNTPITGPYISDALLINKPVGTPREVSVTYSPSTRYYENAITLCPGQWAEYYITCPEETYFLAQTFGVRDTKMYLYDSEGSLLKEDDDSGYNLNSFLVRFLNAGETYTLKVEFYNETSYGNIKVAMMSPNGGVNIDVNSYINSYESIANIPGGDNPAGGCVFSYGRSWLMTYTPTTSGEYTIYTDSDEDTYLYIIDPRDSRMLVLGENKDDDSGEGHNASVTLDLEAGVPYLIVTSLYNPSNITGTPSVVTKISKTVD